MALAYSKFTATLLTNNSWNWTVGSVISVAIIDDFDFNRTALRMRFESAADIDVAFEAASVTEALDLIERNPPQLVILDLHLPYEPYGKPTAATGLDMARRLLRHRAKPRLFIFTADSNPVRIKQLWTEGVHGLFTKGYGGNITDVVRRVASGQHLLQDDLARSIADVQLEENPLDRLTKREFFVVSALVEGDSVNEIANRLHISSNVVYKLKAQSQRKLGAHNDCQLGVLFERYQGLH